MDIGALKTVMLQLGLIMDNECSDNTPIRWAKAMNHYVQPYEPKKDLSKAFNEPSSGITSAHGDYAHSLVIQTNIPYRALCAHHLLPVLGIAHVGYVPKDKVVGLSKLARLVYGISHRAPSLQEHVGIAIAEALMEHLGCMGSMCIINAEHACMACRGIEEPGVQTVTSCIRGIFTKRDSLRSEFLQIVQMNTE